MSSENPYALGIDDVRRFLPHGWPFLFIDRVLEIHPTHSDFSCLPDIKKLEGTRVVALKNVTANEPHINGHFPGFAIMPGVLIAEAMAQTSSFSIYPYVQKDFEAFLDSFKCILLGMDSMRFRKPVTPGDTLIVETTVKKARSAFWRFDAKATVNGEKVADGEIMAQLVLS